MYVCIILIYLKVSLTTKHSDMNGLGLLVKGELSRVLPEKRRPRLCVWPETEGSGGMVKNKTLKKRKEKKEYIRSV